MGGADMGESRQADAVHDGRMDRDKIAAQFILLRAAAISRYCFSSLSIVDNS